MNMKIIEFYVDTARYKAKDANGDTINIEVNYWENTFKISRRNKILEKFARKLLNQKSRVNLIEKVLK